jgi:hypothetical protein
MRRELACLHTQSLSELLLDVPMRVARTSKEATKLRRFSNAAGAAPSENAMAPNASGFPQPSAPPLLSFATAPCAEVQAVAPQLRNHKQGTAFCDVDVPAAAVGSTASR